MSNGIKWAEIKTKVLGTVITAVVIGVGAWSWNWASVNVVFAGDLAGLADDIGAKVDASIEPLTEAVLATNALARQNTADVAQLRAEALRQSIRDLTVEVDEMQTRKASGTGWTGSDETLLGIWVDDLAMLTETLADLEAPP